MKARFFCVERFCAMLAAGCHVQTYDRAVVRCDTNYSALNHFWLTLGKWCAKVARLLSSFDLPFSWHIKMIGSFPSCVHF